MARQHPRDVQFAFLAGSSEQKIGSGETSSSAAGRRAGMLNSGKGKQG